MIIPRGKGKPNVSSSSKRSRSFRRSLTPPRDPDPPSVRTQNDLNEEGNEPQKGVSTKRILPGNSLTSPRHPPSVRIQNDLNEEENESQRGVSTKRVFMENFFTPGRRTPSVRTQHDLNEEGNEPKRGVSSKRSLLGKCLVDNDLQGSSSSLKRPRSCPRSLTLPRHTPSVRTEHGLNEEGNEPQKGVSTKRILPGKSQTPPRHHPSVRTQNDLNEEENESQRGVSTKRVVMENFFTPGRHTPSVRTQHDLNEEENEPKRGVCTKRSLPGKCLVDNDLQGTSSSIKRPRSCPRSLTPPRHPPSVRTQKDLNEEENESQRGVSKKRVFLEFVTRTPSLRTQHDLNEEGNEPKRGVSTKRSLTGKCLVDNDLQGTSSSLKRPRSCPESLTLPRHPPSVKTQLDLGEQENEPQQGVSTKRILPGKCLVDNDLQGTPVLDLINFQSWNEFAHIDCAMHASLVREFYANVKKSKHHSIVSQVLGIEIRLNMEILEKIFKVPNKGVCAYTDKGWPLRSMENADRNACLEFLWGNNQADYSVTPDKIQLTPDQKIMLNMIMDAILPRETNNNKVDCLDGYILFLMYQKRKINLPFIMLHHMLYVGRKGKSLAYGVALTRIFEHFEVPLTDNSGSFNPSWYLDMRSLNWMEIYWYNGCHIDASQFKALPRDIRGKILEKTRMGTTFEEEADSEHDDVDAECEEDQEERYQNTEMCVAVGQSRMVQTENMEGRMGVDSDHDDAEWEDDEEDEEERDEDTEMYVAVGPSRMEQIAEDNEMEGRRGAVGQCRMERLPEDNEMEGRRGAVGPSRMERLAEVNEMKGRRGGAGSSSTSEEGFSSQVTLQEILLQVQNMNVQMQTMNARMDGFKSSMNIVNQKVTHLDRTMNKMWDDIQDRLPPK